MVVAEGLNERELERYVQRIDDRWPLERALLGGARVDDVHGAGPQRERGAEYVVVLVSEGFAGVPWLERVYQAGSLWDAAEQRPLQRPAVVDPLDVALELAVVEPLGHDHQGLRTPPPRGGRRRPRRAPRG